MKIYIIEAGYDYEGSAVKAVFTDKAKAEAYYEAWLKSANGAGFDNTSITSYETSDEAPLPEPAGYVITRNASEYTRLLNKEYAIILVKGLRQHFPGEDIRLWDAADQEINVN